MELLTGPLHKLDVAAFGHTEQCLGIKPGDRLEPSVAQLGSVSANGTS
jgi:hypothetical protein